MDESVTHLRGTQTGQDDISLITAGTKMHFSPSSLMGHFQPTPQSRCQGAVCHNDAGSCHRARWCVLFVILMSWCVSDISPLCPQIFLYDCTEVSPFSLLFFGGDITIQKDGDQETVAVDQWIVFRSPARIAHLVKVRSQKSSIKLRQLLTTLHWW